MSSRSTRRNAAQCEYCLNSGKTNLCQAKSATTQGQGLMPDGSSSRFSMPASETIYHYMGTSTFSPITRCCRKLRLAKVREDAPFDKICYIGCGVTTGIGAVINTAKVEPGSNVVVFRSRRYRPERDPGARLAGANMIVGVDLNPAQKGRLPEKFGMTHFVNPKEVEGDLRSLSCRPHQGRRRLQLRVHR